MSRFWSTCFGGSEEQSSPRRRRRPGVNDSDTDSSYDTDNDESDFEDGTRKYGIEGRGQIGPGMFHREEDIRLEDVVSSGDFARDGTIRGRGEISVLDVPNARVPPAVTQFVELVLQESQRGSPIHGQHPSHGLPPVGAAASNNHMPPRRFDTVLPQVSLLREASRRQAAAAGAAPPAEFFTPGKPVGGERRRANSGGSISSSGSSDGESEGSGSSTSSGIGDSFASGNDTGGSGGARPGGAAKGGEAFQIGNGNRNKVNGLRRTKNHWPHDTLQDVVVEDMDVNNADQFKATPRERMERRPLALVEGVHVPSRHRDWEGRRLYGSELPTVNPTQFGNNRFTRY